MLWYIKNSKNRKSLDCALFYRKARRKRLENVRSARRNTRRSRIFLLTAWVLKPLNTQVLHNRTEHSQDFSIFFIRKNPLNSHALFLIFKWKLYFHSEQKCRQYAINSHKATYNKPIRVRSKFTICNSLQIEIVRQAEFNTFARSSSSLCSVKSGRIVARKNT